MNNKYKIQSLHIKNYKSIEDLKFNLNNEALIIFNGPNGYGKTTVFEAIEIILTNELRKYTDAEQRQTLSFKNSPIHKDELKSIDLTLILGNEEEQISIHRHFPAFKDTNASQTKNIKKIFSLSELYINGVKGDEANLERVLDFNSIKILFNILNYVEQDENTFFLKKDPRDRYKALASLFGAESELQKLDKIKKIQKLLDDKYKTIEKEIKGIKEENNEKFNLNNSETEYRKLIDSLDLIWDKKDIINTDLSEHNKYLEEVDLIKELFEQRDKLLDISFLVNIKSYSNDSFIDILIKYYWKLFNFDSLQEENRIREQYSKSQTANERLIDAITELNFIFLIEDEVWKNIEDKEWSFDKDELKTKLKLIIYKLSALGEHTKILDDLKNKQQSLLSLFKKHKFSISLEEGECPTCGFNWESSEALNASIQKTIENIYSDYLKENTDLEELKNNINNDYLKEIQGKLILANEELLVKTNSLISKDEFSLVHENLKERPKIETFLSLFKDNIKQEIINIVNLRSIQNYDEKKSAINTIIKRNTPTVELTEEQIDSYWQNFEFYFNRDYIKINQLEENKIREKKEYITSQFYLSVNNKINRLYNDLTEVDTTRQQIRDLSLIFDSKIKNYTENIVNNISIPFYIFTGKILQQHKLGSGLILDLKTDLKQSELKINPKNRDQEVLHTLSSGQLSATVISLLLVLNKVYSKSKLRTLLIDDPLQTLDDINTHSLIEVLKYNFKDQQIILSTHEERYSKLIRYKYDRFQLDSKNFSMKDLI